MERRGGEEGWGGEEGRGGEGSGGKESTSTLPLTHCQEPGYEAVARELPDRWAICTCVQQYVVQSNGRSEELPLNELMWGLNCTLDHGQNLVECG